MDDLAAVAGAEQRHGGIALLAAYEASLVAVEAGKPAGDLVMVGVKDRDRVAA
jgi:hypothetical protein